MMMSRTVAAVMVVVAAVVNWIVAMTVDLATLVPVAVAVAAFDAPNLP